MSTARRTALVIGNRVPFPLDDGWKLRTYHVLRGLTRVADVTLVTFHDGDQCAIEGLRASLDAPIDVITVPPPKAHSPLRLLLGLITPLPLHAWNQRSPAMRRAIEELAQRRHFDVAVAELTALSPYLDLLPAETRRVIDTHNIDSLVSRRYVATLRGPLRRAYAALTARKQQRYERAAFAAADLVWVCSEPERERLVDMVPAARVAVVPNGFEATSLGTQNGGANSRAQRLMFCGLMSYHPNVDAVRFFADEILPGLKATAPGLEFWVVGRDPTPEVRALAARDPAVRVTGRVADVRALLDTASVVVVPLRAGGGTRLKILEALSAGKPVVSTSVGMEGLDLVPEQHLLLADTPGTFGDAVRRLLRDPAAATRLGAQGRAAIAQRYSWSTIEQTLRRSLGLSM